MIVLARAAAADIDEIARWISGQNGAQVAARITQRLFVSMERLAAFPGIGRVGWLQGTREFTASGLPYLIVYRSVGPGDIEVARVLHNAMRWPPEA